MPTVNHANSAVWMSGVDELDGGIEVVPKKRRFLEGTPRSPKSRQSRSGAVYNESDMTRERTGQGAYATDNRIGKKMANIFTTPPPTVPPTQDGGVFTFGGNQKRKKGPLAEKKGRRGRANHSARKEQKSQETNDEAAELQRQQSKLLREYSGKRKTSPHFHLVYLVLIFLKIIIKAHTTEPRYLPLKAAFQEAADACVFPTSEYKVRRTYYSWLNSGQLVEFILFCSSAHTAICATISIAVITPQAGKLKQAELSVRGPAPAASCTQRSS